MDDENRTIGGHDLTFEMNAIIDAIISGLNVKGFAYAGAGKSSLLRAVEKYHENKTGLYTCYNKSLEQEARTLFKGHSVHIATSHSFALNSFDKQTRSRFMLKINEKLTFDHVVSFGQVGAEHEYFQLLELNKNWRTLVQVAECFISTASQSLSSIHLTQKTHNLVNQLVKKKVSH